MKAVVLLSGGLDSTVALAQALSKRRDCLALTFDYHQRNAEEVAAAKDIAKHYDVEHKILQIDPQCFITSALVSKCGMPQNRTGDNIKNDGIPVTYVPARNTVFIAYAIGQAEVIGAQEIYFAANASEHPLYPDTRPVFRDAFQNLVNVATKQAVEGRPPQLLFPYAKWSKGDIVAQGYALQVPFERTVSCYSAEHDTVHCGRCDACYLRKEAFVASGIDDPTHYIEPGLPLGAASFSNLM